MNISQNSNYVLTHPFTKQAAEQLLNGDITGLKFILDSLQEDVYHSMLKSCADKYKRFKKENYPIIEEEIKLTAPPDNLNIKLPIPDINAQGITVIAPVIINEPCVVVAMPKPKVCRMLKVVNQLEFEFFCNEKEPPLLVAL